MSKGSTPLANAIASNVRYSKFSHTLRFNIEVNAETIRMVEDSLSDKNASYESIAASLAETLVRGVLTDYHRGGQRRKGSY